MERYQIDDFKYGMGITPDGGINVPTILQASIVRVLCNGFIPPFPNLPMRPSTMVGAGVERAQRLKPGWWAPTQFQIAGELNCETAARLGKRCLGGVTSFANLGVGTTAKDYMVTNQVGAAGRIPELTTFLAMAGGFKFVYPALAVGKFTVQFAGENDVTFAADMINTGMWMQNDGDEIDPAIDLDALDVPVHHTMHPAGTWVTFSDGTTIDYGTDADLISGSCSFDNQIVVRQLPRDPFKTLGTRKGAYARDIHHGKRVPYATVRSFMRSDLEQFHMMMNGTDITSLKYLFIGQEKIGATAFDYEFEWTFPVSEIESVSGTADSNDSAIDTNFYPKADADEGMVTQRVRVAPAAAAAIT